MRLNGFDNCFHKNGFNTGLAEKGKQLRKNDTASYNRGESLTAQAEFTVKSA